MPDRRATAVRAGLMVAGELGLVLVIWLGLKLFDLPRGHLPLLLSGWGLCFVLHAWPVQPALYRLSSRPYGLVLNVCLCSTAIWWAVAATELTMIFPVITAFSVSELAQQYPNRRLALAGGASLLLGTLTMQVAVHRGLIPSPVPSAIGDELAVILAGVGCVLLSRAVATSTQEKTLQARLDAQQRQVHEELRRAALYDQLTGLLSRGGIKPALEAVCASADLGRRSAVLFMDLDGFKAVNDSLGHDAGDQLLRTIAGRIEDVLPPHAAAARMGGDEFVVVLFDLESSSAIDETVADLRAVISQPVVIGSPSSTGESTGPEPTAASTYVQVGVSIGACAVGPGTNPESVLREADQQMYVEKAHRRREASRI